MSTLRAVPIGEVVEFVGGGTPKRSRVDYFGGPIPWVTPKDMKSWDIYDSQIRITQQGLDNSAAKLVPANSVLIVVRSGVLKHSLPVGINRRPVAVNQDLKALICSDVFIPDYLAWYLRAQAGTILAWVRATTADNFPVENLKQLTIPQLPIADQQRIVDILNKVEILRGRRRATVRALAELSSSLFIEIFGDPDENPHGWELKRFGGLLQESPRNGLSPSNSGEVHAKVLTLSAITGSRFNESALKVSTFKSKPPVRQTVNRLDFLVCRGNGNINLMGRGFFPPNDMPDTTFPDTMIAARVNPKIVIAEYLEHVWGMRVVRDQLEAAARTTNGTFKINQKALESIELIVPPIGEQERFADRVRAIQRLAGQHVNQLGMLTELSASLQHRAFRAEL